MAKQTIDIGSSANDGTGDPLRTAFDKCNDNFTELYAVTPPEGMVGIATFISQANGYTGGGASNLDGETTVGVDVPAIYWFKHTTLGWKHYILRAGTDAESSPDIIRPDDYNGSTNAKVFEIMS